MIESTMDHAIGLGRAAAQAGQVFQVAAMRLRACGHKRLFAGIRPRQAQNLVTGAEKFGNNGRADKAGGTGKEYTHEHSPVVWREYRVHFHPVKVVILYWYNHQ